MEKVNTVKNKMKEFEVNCERYHGSEMLKHSDEDENFDMLRCFRHKSFDERLAEYDGKITAVDYEWGEPKGKEML